MSNSAALFWSLATALPLLWMFMSSFKTAPDISNNLWGLPHRWTVANFQSVWTGNLQASTLAAAVPLSRYFANSVIVVTSALFLTLAMALPTAYALVRLQFRGRGLILFGFVCTLAIPVNALVIPIWKVENGLNITDSYIGLILPYVGTAMPYAVLLLAAYFRGFPREIEDAARVDGLGTAGIVSRVVVPLSKGPLSAIAVLLAYGFWNDFLFALVLMPTSNMETLPVGVVQFTQANYGVPMNLVMAALTIVVVPILVLYIALQRHIVGLKFQVNK